MTDYKQELIDALELSYSELDKAAKTFMVIDKLTNDDGIKAIIDSASLSSNIAADNFDYQREQIEKGLGQYANQKQSPPIEVNQANSNDDLSRLAKQAHAAALSLVCDDHYKTLNDNVLGNMLWLLEERIGELCKVVNTVGGAAK